MNISSLRKYASLLILAAAVAMACYATWLTGEVPAWFIAIVSAVAGYLWGTKTVDVLPDGARPLRAVSTWAVKPIAKWIALAALGALLAYAVPAINKLTGQTYEVGDGITVVIPPSATAWGTMQTSNIVQWLRDYITTL